MEIKKSLRIMLHLLRTSITSQMQYRADFLIHFVLAFFWTSWTVTPLILVFRLRSEVAGFTFEQAMLVMSAFMILRSILDGFINPNLIAVVDHIRSGTLDFVLLKPADSQLLVSTSRVSPSRVVDFGVGVAIATWSVSRIDPAPGALDLLAGAALLVAGAAILYSLWLVVICTAFWFVRVDNLAYLFSSIFDAARWPITVFRGWVRFVLTFVVPLALMTSFPAMALLGRLDATAIAGALAFALLFLFVSRRVWLWAIQHYASASS